MIYFKTSLVMSENMRGEFNAVLEESQELQYRHTAQSVIKNKSGFDEVVDHALDILFMTQSNGVGAIESNPIHENLVQRCVDIMHPDVPLSPQKVTIMHVEPHGVVPEHSDSPQYGRRTSIVFPLRPYNPTDWAVCRAGEESPDTVCEWHPCYAFSTEARHEVYNNGFDRAAVQIWVDLTTSEAYDRYKKDQLFCKPLNSNDFYFQKS